MKSLVVYDSQYGNTAKIAEQIGSGLAASGSVRVVPAAQAGIDDLQGLEILAVGSPTQRLTATPVIMAWIKALPAGSLAGIKAAAFDTRFTAEKIQELSRLLAFFVRIFGYAADPIARELKKKGADLILPPEGFFVSDTEGPLLEQELERAAEWARELLKR